MFTIRPELLDAIHQADLRPFAEALAARMRELHPKKCQELGNDDLREVLRYGIMRAESHGIQDPLAVARFINFMFVLGPYFDQESPWARESLESTAGLEDAYRLDILSAEFKAEAEPASGPEPTANE